MGKKDPYNRPRYPPRKPHPLRRNNTYTLFTPTPSDPFYSLLLGVDDDIIHRGASCPTEIIIARE